MDIESAEEQFRFHVALSFAGEDREFVEEVAIQLRAHDVKVFYDRFEEAKLWGKNLFEYLQDIYSKHAKFTVMFISKHYREKLWTTHERESMQARAFKESTEYILPARFDETEIPGVLPTTGYISLSGQHPSYLVGLILRKLDWEAKTRWWGKWQVPSVTSAYQATLKILEVHPTSFHFEILTCHGAHTGEVEGLAHFINPNEAVFISEEKGGGEPCRIDFKRLNDKIQVNESSGCNFYHGMQAFFTGDYQLKKDSFYNIKGIEDRHLSLMYKYLGSDHWSYYADCFCDIHNDSPSDGNGKVVVSGGMPGLYTICESMLVIEGEVVYGAFLKENEIFVFPGSLRASFPQELVNWCKTHDSSASRTVNLG